MKDVLKLISLVLGGLGTFISVVGGAILLNTWWIAFVVLFVVKILVALGVFVVALSWWTVILVPVGMFVGGFVCIGFGMLMGVIVASLAESL